MVGGVLVTAAAASPKGYWPEGNYPDPDSDPYPEEKAFYTIMLTLGIAGLLLGILAAILSCGAFLLPDPDSDPYPEEKAFYTIMLTLGIAGLLLGILAAILSCGAFLLLFHVNVVLSL